MKTCSVCTIEKEYDEFYYNSSTDTLVSMCKTCYKRYTALKRRADQRGVAFNAYEFRQRKLYLSNKKPKEIFR